MKKIIINSFVLIWGLSLNSCNNEEKFDTQINDDVQNQRLSSQMLEFENEEQFLEAINNCTTRSIGNITSPYFTSLLTEVNLDDPLISDFSDEDKAVIAQEHLTYYDVFELEDFFPNENFARLININGEVCVKDTIYKITEKGTLITQKSNKDELELTYYQIKDEPLFQNGETSLKLTENVKILNTFNLTENTGPCVFSEAQDVIEDVGESPSSGSSSLTLRNNNQTGTNSGGINTPVINIPWSSFPTYSAGYKTFVGKLWSKVFGDRSTKHHELGNGYRVNGSLYDYNYGIYHECGAFVSMSKKRGGFFKAINGWKDASADELIMDWEPVVLELDLKIPSNLTPPANRNTVLGYEKYCQLLGESKKCCSILGFDITEKQLYQWTGQGLKYLFDRLNEKCNTKIDEDTEALRIIVPTKVYTIVYPSTTWKHYQNKYRKVFDSGVRFVISNKLFTAPLSISTWGDLYEVLRNIPQKDIKKGTVKLAGRKDGKWGGMIINKD